MEKLGTFLSWISQRSRLNCPMMSSKVRESNLWSKTNQKIKIFWSSRFCLPTDSASSNLAETIELEERYGKEAFTPGLWVTKARAGRRSGLNPSLLLIPSSPPPERIRRDESPSPSSLQWYSKASIRTIRSWWVLERLGGFQERGWERAGREAIFGSNVNRKVSLVDIARW